MHVNLKLDGRDYVIVPREEFDRLAGLAKVGEMPPVPTPDADGNYPAVEFARTSIARKIVRERANAGITQRELAKLAGIAFETLCRLEKGRHTPSIPTMNRIDQALKQAAARGTKRQRGRKKA